MYPKFIELHWNTIPVSYNVENISWFGDKFIYIVGIDIAADVDESYDEIKALIKDCGCLIHKADPRLDTEHPLTMNDLKEMIDEPVWNSNTGRWMLVNRIDDVAGTDFAILTESNGIGYDFDEAILKAKPLYRMKQ